MSKALVETNAAEQSHSLIKQTGIVICASAVIAVCARLMVPLPFTPVPLTLANFGVLLVGLTLGSRRGFAAAALYLAWGAMGLPVFASAGPGSIAQLLGPTGGYLLGVPGDSVPGRLDRRARRTELHPESGGRADGGTCAVRRGHQLAGGLYP